MSVENQFKIISPVDGRVYATRSYSESSNVAAALDRAGAAFRTWRSSLISERASLITALADALLARKEHLGEIVAWQIGRPIAQADETARFKLVSEKHIEAVSVLEHEPYPSEPSIERHVRRSGQGIHFSIAPWNYPLGLLPWLIVAPVLGGNTVILKHSDQTALVAEVINEALAAIGAPEGVLQTIAVNHRTAGEIISSGRVKAINFIGSVRGGLEIHKAAAGTLTHVHLELGGKDPAYIRPDADIGSAVADIADGSFSNSGQSCCSVERIYVHESVHDAFVERFKQEMQNWSVGNPITEAPAIGPMVKHAAAEYVRTQIADAVINGAKKYVAETFAGLATDENAYVTPTLLTNLDHSMSIMRDELFGPVACIQKVASDEEAVLLMNDSEFGLTASIWTADTERGVELGDQLETGTVFVNRCDHADLYLPWGGEKNSGLGRVNGRDGLLGVTASKSFHVKAV
ncbi:aldehyde dehydrogenase family protein [Phyllobacterium endophyticum]|uniref:Succinate-semialdehyde dehydrogenase n=1 Tax=Phyllobacterium endophyticum TaxID=1149773 RepID=A0A2P7ARY7_9HYPH|nr:aldehyde dehydrogenase family protein [Phyllobacterium endophyticum]MBB3236698.1 acyl-CoA reductase-like NAD-dependent aldehyde dehydrogenase [Phyllobacterium endophyticum]PSH56991.1 succinate-semialdehyde dehydrogenase [Phyllobacterium endophyticum]TYR39679.1 aldehyde dehydrogenase family protein [Phyllobacterium endophyticum]